MQAFRSYIIVMITVLFVSTYSKAEINQEATEDIKAAITICSDNLVESPPPLPTESKYKRDQIIESYQTYKRYRDEALTSNPNIKYSSIEYREKTIKNWIPFCNERFSTTTKSYEKAEASEPKAEAIADISYAFKICRAAATESKNGTLNGSTLSNYYETYIKFKDSSIKDDPRIINYIIKKEGESGINVKENIDKCENDLEKPYQQMVKKNEEEKERQKQEDLAAELAANEEQEKTTKIDKAIAIKKGLKDITYGIISLLDELKNGYITLESASSYLIKSDKYDDFKVESIVDNYVIYSHQTRNYNLLQIALPKGAGYYGQGAALDPGYFKISSVKNLKTVLGKTIQIIVLKKVDPI